MPPQLIDTHCHLDLPPLVDCLAAYLGEAAAAGITGWIMPSVHPDRWPQIQAIASLYPGIVPAYGIHPLHVAAADASCLQRLESLAAAGGAIGEIGLDADGTDHDRQETVFRHQLSLARRLGLPVLIHCRRAIGRTLDILRQERIESSGGIMHAFSGSLESARDCIRLNLALSISGMVMRPTAARLHRIAREVPLEHLVLETDAPTRTPFGQQSESHLPALLLTVARSVAALRGCSLAEVAAVTSATARRIVPLL